MASWALDPVVCCENPRMSLFTCLPACLSVGQATVVLSLRARAGPLC